MNYTRDIAMKLGMRVLNRIILKLAKLQAFIFCMKKLFKKNVKGEGGGGGGGLGGFRPQHRLFFSFLIIQN